MANLASAGRRQAAGIATCLSHGSVCTIEDLAATGVAPRWMQVFIYKDRGFTRELTERAQKSDYDALVLTIDNQMLGNRERDIRNGFGIPPRFRPAEYLPHGVEGAVAVAHAHRIPAHHLRQLCAARASPPTSGRWPGAWRRCSIPSCRGTMSTFCASIWRGRSSSRACCIRRRPEWPLDHGVDGIIVSNHGGRQLDGAAGESRKRCRAWRMRSRGAFRCSSMAASGAAPTFVKALALGATACLMATAASLGPRGRRRGRGRAYARDLPPRARPRAMGLCGISRIADIGRNLLFTQQRRNRS